MKTGHIYPTEMTKRGQTISEVTRKIELCVHIHRNTHSYCSKAFCKQASQQASKLIICFDIFMRRKFSSSFLVAIMAFHWHKCVRQVCHANDAIVYLLHRFYAQYNGKEDESIDGTALLTRVRLCFYSHLRLCLYSCLRNNINIWKLQIYLLLLLRFFYSSAKTKHNKFDHLSGFVWPNCRLPFTMFNFPFSIFINICRVQTFNAENCLF